MKCPRCSNDTLKHTHECAHGIAGTHMQGSEKFECDCGFNITDSKAAEQHNLKFILDT